MAAFVGSSTQTSNGTTSLTVTKPTGTVDGHLVLIYLDFYGPTNGISAGPAGFTLLDNNISGTQSAANHHYYCYYKVASSEPASWTITFSSASVWSSCVAYVLSDVGIVVNSSTKADATAYVTALPSATDTIASTSDATVYQYGGTTSAASGTVTFTAPASLANVVQVSNSSQGGGLCVGWGTNVSAPGACTASVALDYIDSFQDLQSAGTLAQTSFRFRNDDGTEATATWSAGESAAVTAPLVTNVRLRVQLDSSGDAASAPFQLEYKKSTDANYAKVLTAQPTNTLPTFVAKGTFASGTAAITPGLPTGYQAGDLFLLFVETANQAMTAPTGYTQVTNSPQSTGTAAAAGGVRLTVFYKLATASETAPTTADSGDHQTAIIMAFRGVDNTTPFNTTAGKIDSTASTAVSCPAVTTTAANCLIVNAIALDADLASTTNLSAAANANLSSVTLRHTQTVSAGAGGGLAIITGGLAAAGSTGSTTATDTTSEVRTYLTMALNPAPASQVPLLLATSANIAAGGGTATTAQLTPPAGKTTAEFQAGLLADDTNPLTAIDLTADTYTELEWCLQATESATNGDIYQFRVTAGGSPLATYAVTPQWTIGTSTTPVGVQVQTLWNQRAPTSLSRQALWNTRTTTAQSRQALWKVRTSATNQRQALWQVRTAQGGGRQILWNLRTPTGANRQGLWQTRTTLARTRQTLWNISTSVTTSRQQLWNLRATTGISRQELWNQSATTTVSRQELWQTRTTLARTRQALWNSRVTTSKSRQHLWQVRSAQGGGRQLAWQVRANVGAPVTARWTVRGGIGASQENVWLVRSLLHVSTQHTWNVSGLAPPTAVGNQIQTIWNLHATAAIDRQGRWQVRNTLAMPLLALWHNRTNLFRTNTFAWPIRQIIPREVIASWQVFSVVPTTLVTTSQSLVWATLGKTAVASLASWNTRTPSGPELLTRWQDRTSSLRDLTFVWKIRLITAQARTLSWHIRVTLGDNPSCRWHTRATTAHDRAFLWEVRQGLSLQVSHIWPVRLGVNRTVQSQWRERSLSQTTLQLLWDVFGLQMPVATQSALTWNLQTNTTRDTWTLWQVKSLTACQRLMRWILHDRRAWKAATLQEDARSTRLESQSGTQLDPAPYGGGGLQETS